MSKWNLLKLVKHLKKNQIDIIIELRKIYNYFGWSEIENYYHYCRVRAISRVKTIFAVISPVCYRKKQFAE